MPNRLEGKPGPIDCASVMPDLAELCRIHDVSLDLIRHSEDVNDLVGRILLEYERRLKEMSPDTLDGEHGPSSTEDAKKLSALVMFAGQAVAVKERAVAAAEQREKAEELRRLNEDLERALAREERTRHRLDDVLSALDAGIMIVGADGRIQNANPAAARLTGRSGDDLVGESVEPFLGRVERGCDGEVTEGEIDDPKRTLLVARRDLRGDASSEVVLLSDVTERDGRLEERHRLERFAELLRTLSVLSHKINNPLTALLGRAQILSMRKDTDAGVRKAVEVIEDSAKRIAAYIRELAIVVRDGREEALQRLLDTEEERSSGDAARR